MNGAQSLMRTLTRCGVDVCFSNPGTSEMHFVAALDAAPEMRAVLCLFEGVATGAADGYARVAGKPAATLLHLGPGLANGLANLHNARRAQSPVVNIIGDHATFHLQYDALLTSDIVDFARTVSAWIHESKSAATLAGDVARAVQAARCAPGGIASLVLPADVAWNPAERVADPLPDIGPAVVSAGAVDDTARQLANGRPSALLLRGAALHGAGLEAAGRVQARTGARLLCDTFAPVVELGAGRVPVERIPYHGEQITPFLAGIEQLILVGAKPPVAFFAYPGKPSWCVPEGCAISHLSLAHEDGARALADLADALGAPATSPRRVPLELPDLPTGRLGARGVAQTIAALTPEHAIVADESATSSVALLATLARARPHLHLPLAGGAIGQGLPLAVGAAIAAPGRKVVCPIGDGGAAMTMQALWTMAREQLDITAVVYANRSYAVLNVELQRMGIADAGAKALSMLDLTRPEMNWARIGDGLGVTSTRATTAEAFVEQYRSAMNTRGPCLIEAVIEPPRAAGGPPRR